jgi:nucleotide-binding universal stress UspA family protein
MNDAPILICFDGSEGAKQAIREVSRLQPGSKVAILTVWQPFSMFAVSGALMAGNVGDLDREAERGAQELAAEGARMASELWLYPEEHVSEGRLSVARAILDWCDAHDPSLVALGATGRSALADMLTGSVANAIVHHAPATVLLAHAPKASEQHAAAARTATSVA